MVVVWEVVQNVSDSLAYPNVGKAGVFNYLIVSNILSNVLYERDTKRVCSKTRVVGSSEVNWWQNENEMEYSCWNSR